MSERALIIVSFIVLAGVGYMIGAGADAYFIGLVVWAAAIYIRGTRS
jgi:hypothetical protein